ncbi:MAG: hypothetical protein ABI672_05445 [Vicinamibacteria bacterium]
MLKNLATGVFITALPFLASGVVAAANLPPLLAYLLFPGRNLLMCLGAIVIIWSIFQSRFSVDAPISFLESVSPTLPFTVLGFALILIIAFVRVPQQEKEAQAFGGDEPKYLRIAFSLLRDTDADISSGRTETPDLSLRFQQTRNLILTGRDAFSDLFKPVEVPPDHVWNVGNWTVRGLHGGMYHLQPPGLPAIIAVGLGIGEAVLPERDPGIYVAVLLSLIWALGAWQLWRLSQEISGDALGSAVFVAIVLLSAPVYVGGYQLFPESVSLLIFPWLIRRLRGSELKLGAVPALFTGFVSGYLLWIHPKLTLVAGLFALMGLIRPRTTATIKALFFFAFALTAFSSLLYCFHISGLLRPEGLYIRQAEEYVGSPNPFSLRFLAGLVKALIGGRDGLFVFAPLLLLGFMTAARKLQTRAVLEMLSLFLIVWLTSAVHDGASLGSPARLMAPVAFIPAFFLVRALRDGASPKLLATAVLLFVLGSQITDSMTSDWRKNVNPYRLMFTNSATNFEPSLPGNSFSNEAYGVDLAKAALIFVTLFVVAIYLNRSDKFDRHETDPARFGWGVLATVLVLAFGLHWLTPA